MLIISTVSNRPTLWRHSAPQQRRGSLGDFLGDHSGTAPSHPGEPTPSAPGFRQQRCPPDVGLRGITWVQNQFPKPDISAGHMTVAAIPGPKPVSGLANSLTAATGVLGSAKGIPPQAFRTATALSDVELFGADPVWPECGTQQ